MNVLRKTEREAALDLLPIWAKKMNEISERDRHNLSNFELAMNYGSFGQTTVDERVCE